MTWHTFLQHILRRGDRRHPVKPYSDDGRPPGDSEAGEESGRCSRDSSVVVGQPYIRTTTPSPVHRSSNALLLRGDHSPKRIHYTEPTWEIPPSPTHVAPIRPPRSPVTKPGGGPSRQPEVPKLRMPAFQQVVHSALSSSFSSTSFTSSDLQSNRPARCGTTDSELISASTLFGLVSPRKGTDSACSPRKGVEPLCSPTSMASSAPLLTVNPERRWRGDGMSIGRKCQVA